MCYWYYAYKQKSVGVGDNFFCDSWFDILMKLKNNCFTLGWCWLLISAFTYFSHFIKFIIFYFIVIFIPIQREEYSSWKKKKHCFGWSTNWMMNRWCSFCPSYEYISFNLGQDWKICNIIGPRVFINSVCHAI